MEALLQRTIMRNDTHASAFGARRREEHVGEALR